MSKPLSLNILGQYVRDGAALLDWVSKAKPDAALVMDSVAVAQGIRQRSPQTTVIYRAYNPNDAKWHEATTPGEWLAAHKPFAVNGVAVQCYNEPSSAGLFAALPWLEQVVAQCPADMTLALPNTAVGNPNEQDIIGGKYDRLLRLVCGTRHILVLHEYFRADPTAEAPYFCGRFIFWLRRAAALGLPAPRIVITEHGRDYGGGKNDGWKGQNWSEDYYFSLLVKARELYKPYNIPVCVFSYGYGANNDWASFDVQDAPTLLDKMATYQEETPVTQPIPAPTTGGEKRRLTTMPGEYINTRAQPNGADIGDLLKGDVVTVYLNAKQGDWVYQTPIEPVARPTGRQNAAPGWVSLQGGAVVFTKVVEPPPVEPPPVTHPTPSEVAAALEALNGAKADNTAVGVQIDNAIALIKGELLPAAPNTVTLDIPFVSQLGSEADVSPNDCGIAALLMLTRYAQKSDHWGVPDVPTVDMLVPLTPLGNNPKNLMTFSDVIALARRLGYKAEYRSGMTPDKIRDSIRADRPVMCLVDYSIFNLKGAKISHFMVASGFHNDEFICQDSYLQGANVHLDSARLSDAMKIVPGNAGEYQALVLVR